MSKRTNKKRFSALIHETTYNKVNEFVKENESWLEDYAMFMAIRPCFDYACRAGDFREALF